MVTLTDLPYTLFADIIARLPAPQAIRCRRLSRAAHAALTRTDLSISLILTHFPRSLEGRQLRLYLRTDDHDALDRGDWAAVFATLARRYFHLGRAVPWRVVKVPVFKQDDEQEQKQEQKQKHLRGVTPWNCFLSLNGRTAPFYYADPVWTVAAAEGLLVYPAPLGGADTTAEDYSYGCYYRARDLDSGREVPVPFDLRGRIVRRVRISHGILVLEWCEQEPLKKTESAHRHYATAYTVRRVGSWDGVIPRRQQQQQQQQQRDTGATTATPNYSWEFVFRCEWKMHPLGLPVSHQDRFYSAHNGTHYALYTWQPTHAEPLERLVIWELGPPSAYRPSQDPSSGGTLKPDVDHSGPHIIRSMANSQLRDWGIRQGDTPSLRTLALDESTWDEATRSACGHVFFTQEEHRWSAGPHSSANPPRLHHVKTTGIPLLGHGPRWVDDCGGGGGGVNLKFCWRGRWRRQMTEMDMDMDMDMDDDDTEHEANSESHQTWPGRAPCWRHDDFPYVTVAEVLDAAAGVRVIARDCFMLETLSVHIRPKMRVQGVDSGGAKTTNFSSNKRRRKSDTTKNQQDGSSGGATTQGPDGQEVQFADDLWSEMMAKGVLCGDERRLVGEDGRGDVTILVF